MVRFIQQTLWGVGMELLKLLHDTAYYLSMITRIRCILIRIVLRKKSMHGPWGLIGTQHPGHDYLLSYEQTNFETVPGFQAIDDEKVLQVEYRWSFRAHLQSIGCKRFEQSGVFNQPSKLTNPDVSKANLIAVILQTDVAFWRIAKRRVTCKLCISRIRSYHSALQRSNSTDKFSVLPVFIDGPSDTILVLNSIALWPCILRLWSFFS
jgi:hypothetical protein